MLFPLVWPLHTTIQNYAWGKLGSHSEVSLLIKNVCPHFTIEETKPYAEVTIFFLNLFLICRVKMR